jgi:hypothetical protein
MKLFLLNILKKAPWLYYLIFSIRYKREISKASCLIIVTTPGHVGSSTTHKSLQNIVWDSNTRIYDIHSLEERFNNKSPINSISARHVLQDVIREMLINGKLKNKSINIITLVRDPIARALGGIFQNPKVFIDEDFDKYNNIEEYAEGCEKIKNQILKSDYLINTIRWQMAFYERELKKYWGFDFLNPDIVFENGFAFFQFQNFRFFIFALEYLDEIFSKKIKHYFNEEIELVNANIYSSKKNVNANFYSYCKQNMKFSSDLVNKIYDHTLLLKIYPVEKLKEFNDNWIQ